MKKLITMMGCAFLMSLLSLGNAFAANQTYNGHGQNVAKKKSRGDVRSGVEFTDDPVIALHKLEPKSIKLPWANARVRIDMGARMAALHNFQSKNDYNLNYLRIPARHHFAAFLPVPLGSTLFSTTYNEHHGNTILGSSGAVINIETLAKTPYGLFRGVLSLIFTEEDIPAIAASSSLNADYAYMQLGNVIVGVDRSQITQWMGPEILDIPASASGVANAQVRYIMPLKQGMTLTLSAENPFSDIGIYTKATAISAANIELVDNDNESNQMPDFTLLFESSGEWGKLLLGGLVRRIGIDSRYITSFSEPNFRSPPVIINSHRYGFGFRAALKFRVKGKNTVYLGYMVGRGLGRYLTFHSYQSSVIIVSPNPAAIGTPNPLALPTTSPATATKLLMNTVSAGYVGFQYWFNDAWRMNVLADYTYNPWHGIPGRPLAVFPVGTSGIAAADIVNRSYASIQSNISWNPAPNVIIGLGWIHAARRTLNGHWGHLDRATLALKYFFI